MGECRRIETCGPDVAFVCPECLSGYGDPRYRSSEGLCLDCHIFRCLPKRLRGLEWPIQGGMPPSGVEWIDHSGPKVGEAMLMSKGRPRE